MDGLVMDSDGKKERITTENTEEEKREHRGMIFLCILCGSVSSVVRRRLSFPAHASRPSFVLGSSLFDAASGNHEDLSNFNHPFKSLA
jgi:hypothetical protein